MRKKLHYLLELLPLIREIPQWYVIIPVVLRIKKFARLKLKSGTFFSVSHYLDFLTIKEIFLQRQYHCSQKNPKLILDIGGNIGTYSISAALQYPKARIFTYEPALFTYRLLQKNLADNGIRNVTALRQALGKKVAKLHLYSHPATGLSSLYNSRNNVVKEQVDVTTLDQVFRSHKISAVDILKMDCEGAEYDILLNASSATLSKVKCMFIEYHDALTSHHHSELVTLLLNHNYSVTITPHPLETAIGILSASK